MAPTPHRLARHTTLALAAGLAIGALWLWRCDVVARAGLVELAESTGLAAARPALTDEAIRRTDRVEGKVEIALGLVDMELDLSWVLELPEDERASALAAGIDRLAAAREIATELVDERPASARAWLALGGATYLGLARAGDPQANTDVDAWKGPLDHARKLNPHDPGATRLLVAAQLDRWSLLDSADRQDTIRLVRDAFRDPRTFDLFYERWLRIAPTLTDALDAMPATSRAWRIIQDHFSRLEDRERQCLARERWHQALDREIPERLQQGIRMLAGGETRHGRERLLAAVTSRRPSAHDVATLEAALASLPPGPIRKAESRALGDWLRWGIDTCLFDECALSDRAMSRLAGLIEDLPAADSAAAAAAIGDLRRAAAMESRRIDHDDPDWQPLDILRRRQAGEDGRTALRTSGLEDQWRRRDARRFIAFFANQQGQRRAVEFTNSAPALVELYVDGHRLGCRLAVDGTKIDVPREPHPVTRRIELDTLYGTVGPGATVTQSQVQSGAIG